MQLFKKQCYVKTNEYFKRELSYGGSPQQMDVVFLFDFG